MNPISKRVRTALEASGLQQKRLAAKVSMAPDALSRALSGKRGFAADELAQIARLLDADVHYLITGEPDPHRLVLSACHSYDRANHSRSVDGLSQDKQLLSDLHLAYVQALA